MDNASIRVAVKEWLAESADGRSSPKARAKWGAMEQWRVGGVTDFGSLLKDRAAFSVEVGGWDVSGATTMELMFEGCAAFDADLERGFLRPGLFPIQVLVPPARASPSSCGRRSGFTLSWP